VRRLAVGCVLGYAAIARADDPRATFGFDKNKQPAPDARDDFGFGKKPVEEPLDCSDGTTFGCTGASDPLDEHGSPYSLSSWLAGSYLRALPTANVTHDQVAHYAIGASRDEGGVIIGGATGLENRWLIEGAPADGLRTGAADTRVPLSFLSGMRVTVGGFTARDRTSTGGMIDADLLHPTKAHEVDARAYLRWTADPRRRPIAPATYFVRRGQATEGPGVSASIVATGPHYAAGIAPELDSTKFRWRSGTLTDLDGDSVPDGLPGLVITQAIDDFTETPLTYRVPFFARGEVGEFDLVLVGTAGSDARYLFNSTLQAAGVNGRTLGGDAIATWRRAWKSTRVRAQFAWHRTTRHESARDPDAADRPQLLSAYVPETLAEDPMLAGACNDSIASDRFPTVTNCPVPNGYFASGGAGPLSDVTGDRPSLTADVAHREGNHVLRAGATGEDTRLVTETRFTGGTQIRSLFPQHMSERRFVDPNAVCGTDAGTPCPTVDTSVLRYRTRYTAAYVEDTWQADPKIAFDGGLRWELMWVGTQLHFSNELSPRAGVSWDPLGKGRSRIWTSAGRSFAMLPAGLGTTILSRDRTVDKVISPFGEGRLVDTGAVYTVAVDVKPIAQDEITAGAEVALAKTVHATVYAQGRWLEHALDTTLHGFDNPGRYGGTPALRETLLVGGELSTTPIGKLVLRAGYFYGRTIGSWTGAFDPRQGAVLYAGTDYDASSQGQLGRLPTDMGHRTYIEAQRIGHAGPVKFAISTRLTTASGRPRSVLGDSDEGIIFLIPRGTAGRSPLVSQANVRVAASWHDFDITLDLFNVFDRRTATSTEELYTGGTLHPIDHGTLEDLVFMKNEDGADVRRNPSFGVGTAFQSPLAAWLGIHRAF
jgi:hypothetical protein